MSADGRSLDADLDISSVGSPAPRRYHDTIAAGVASSPRRRSWRRTAHVSTLLAVGSHDAVADLIDCTRRSPQLGWRVSGVCTPTGVGPHGAATVAGVPVLGDSDAVARLALTDRFAAVAVTSTPGWTSLRLERLAFHLEGGQTALLADQRLLAPISSRMRIAEVDGLPLLHVARPELTLAQRLIKGMIDRVVALFLLAAVAPVLLSCAVAVGCNGGPILERWARVGRDGQVFALFTFRTTTIDGVASTAVGRVLRRYGLSELPQLFNVLNGSMALVGPRVTRPGEFAGDGGMTWRRLAVKPGVVGLSSARDDSISPAEAAERDMHYVNSWSPAVDAWILFNAVRVALARS